jgi:hypothetical protein
MAPAVIFLSWRQCTVVRPSLQKLFVWWPLSDSLQLRDRRQVSTAVTNTSNVPSSARTMAGSCWVCDMTGGGDGVRVSFSIRVPWGNRVAPWMTLA